MKLKFHAVGGRSPQSVRNCCKAVMGASGRRYAEGEAIRLGLQEGHANKCGERLEGDGERSQRCEGQLGSRFRNLVSGDKSQAQIPQKGRWRGGDEARETQMNNQ